MSQTSTRSLNELQSKNDVKRDKLPLWAKRDPSGRRFSHQEYLSWDFTSYKVDSCAHKQQLKVCGAGADPWTYGTCGAQAVISVIPKMKPDHTQLSSTALLGSATLHTREGLQRASDSYSRAESQFQRHQKEPKLDHTAINERIDEDNKRKSLRPITTGAGSDQYQPLFNGGANNRSRSGDQQQPTSKNRIKNHINTKMTNFQKKNQQL